MPWQDALVTVEDEVIPFHASGSTGSTLGLTQLQLEVLEEFAAAQRLGSWSHRGVTVGREGLGDLLAWSEKRHEQHLEASREYKARQRLKKPQPPAFCRFCGTRIERVRGPRWWCNQRCAKKAAWRSARD